MHAKASNPIAPSLRRFLRGYAWASSALSVLVGASVLFGWAIGSHTLKSLLPGFVEMKANAAVGFVLCGVTLALRQCGPWRSAQRVANLLSVMLVLLGGATILEYIGGFDFGIDQLLFTEAAHALGTSAPGRMALTTAIAFVAAGVSLLLLGHPRDAVARAGQYAALAVAFCGWPTTIGYAYGLRSFFGLAAYTQMALHTAITFSLLAPAFMALRPTLAFVPTILGQRSGSQMARPLVVAAVLFPTLLGRIVLWGERLQHFDPEFGFSVHVILNVIFFVVLAAILANALNHTDAAREKAEDDLRGARDELEARVLQRTLDLAAANEALKSQVQERQRASDALLHSETKFRSLIESANAAIVIANRTGHIQSWNGAAQRIFGYQASEVLGRPLSILMPDEMKAAHEQGLKRVAAGGATKLVGRVAEVPGLHRDGHRVPLELSLTTWDQDGECFFSGIMTDITARKQAQAATTAAKEQAEAANRAKSDFLANMSHEIRTPLNGIIGMTELTLDTPLNRQQRENLDTVASSAEALLEVVNDILDFSKIEAGKFSLEEVTFDPRQVVNSAIRTLQVRADEKCLRLESKIAGDVPAALVGDPLRLRQVLLNLIGNSIKFTKEGEICVRLSGEPCGASAMRMQFSVSDTGIGIATDKQELIFRAFSQADSSTTRRYGGTGLGLAISSQLVGLMGGKLIVNSVEGVGSTFEFQVDLPVAVLASGPEDDLVVGNEIHRSSLSKTKALPAIVGRRVLLVEDNAVNQRVAKGMLVAAGHDVIIASNGEEALEQLKHGVFDVVLMDIQMPVMDGLAATRTWRATEPGTSRTPIIAMTAHAMKGDEARCLEAGMDDYLTKPVRRRALLAKIDVWGARAAASKGHVSAVPHVPLASVELDDSANDAVIDRQAFLEEMDHDTALISELVDLFKVDSARQLAVIRQAIASGESAAAAVAAHSLKGTIGHFRAARAYRAVVAFEDVATTGNWDSASETFQHLDFEVARLTEALPSLCAHSTS